MLGLPNILSLFRNEFNKLNSTGARMLDSIYHKTLKLIKNHIFDVKTSRFCHLLLNIIMDVNEGAQWLSGRVLDLRPRVRASPVSLRCGPSARHIYPSLVLVQPRKTCPCLTERLLMGRKESNQTNNGCHR